MHMSVSSIDFTRPGALTLDSVRALLASMDSHTHTQPRATRAGIAVISTTDVGRTNTGDLAFRLETWSARSGHVGADAALNDVWVMRIHRGLRDNWPRHSSECIDT